MRSSGSAGVTRSCWWREWCSVFPHCCDRSPSKYACVSQGWSPPLSAQGSAPGSAGCAGCWAGSIHVTAPLLICGNDDCYLKIFILSHLCTHSEVKFLCKRYFTGQCVLKALESLCYAVKSTDFFHKQDSIKPLKRTFSNSHYLPITTVKTKHFSF